MNRLVASLAMACVAASAWCADKQQVYKWTDANGVVHFSDAPPPQDAKNVQSLHLAGGMATATASSAEDKPKDATGAAAASAAPSNTPPNEAALCKQSRDNLELLQGKTPVGIKSPDGKPVALDDKARDAQIANAKLAIARFCK